MKKLFSLIGIFVFSALVLTGCGGSGDKLVCTISEDGAKGEITATFKNDKVNGLSAVMEFATEEEATQYMQIVQLAEAFMGEDVKIGAKQSGKKITIDDMLPMLEGSTDDDGNEVKITDMTKEEFKANYEEQGYTCK